MDAFELTSLTDHELAAKLRKRGLLDSFTHVGRSVQYADATAKVHFVVVFDNVKTERKVYARKPGA